MKQGGCTAAERFEVPPPIIQYIRLADLQAQQAREHAEAMAAWETSGERAGGAISGLPGTLTSEWWGQHRVRTLAWLVELAGRQKAQAWHMAGEMQASGFYGPLRDDLAAAMQAKLAPKVRRMAVPA